MWIKHSFFKYITGAILIVLFIYLLGKIDFLLNTVMKIIATLFFPIFIAGLLYYILRPIVNLLSKPKYIPRPVAILVIYFLFFGGIYTVIYYGGPFFSQQMRKMSKVIPKQLKSLEGNTKNFIEHNNMNMLSFAQIKHTALSYLSHIAQSISHNMMGVITAVTGVATVLVLVPFVLFYLLNDDSRLAPFLLKFLPVEHVEEGAKILRDIDKTLSTYIIGQATVAVINGILMYLGYLILGVDYPVILALFVVITAIIPLIGSVIGILPAIFIGLMHNPMMVLYIFILLIVVQQLEGNLISPFIMGKRLNLHPLTVLLLLLVMGSVYGFIGILVAVPAYSILKVTVTNFYRFYCLRRKVST